MTVDNIITIFRSMIPNVTISVIDYYTGIMPSKNKHITMIVTRSDEYLYFV